MNSMKEVEKLKICRICGNCGGEVTVFFNLKSRLSTNYPVLLVLYKNKQKFLA